MNKPTKDAAAAFRLAADELVERVALVTTNDKLTIGEVLGCLSEPEELEAILEDILDDDFDHITEVLVQIVKKTKSLSDAITLTHAFSSMEMASKITDNPHILIGLMTGRRK